MIVLIVCKELQCNNDLGKTRKHNLHFTYHTLVSSIPLLNTGKFKFWKTTTLYTNPVNATVY